MANVQLEDGYAKLANALLEGLAFSTLGPDEWKIMMVLFRKIYGWNGKKVDNISLSQFGTMTRMKKPHICRAIGKLLKRNMITRTGNEVNGIITRTGNGSGLLYAIQKDYDLWKSLPKVVTQKKPLPEVATSITSLGNAALPVLGTTKDTLKDNKEITPAKESKPKKAKLTDEEFIQVLKTSKAYKGIDVERELARMDIWLLTPANVRNQQKTRRFITGWLNRYNGPLNYVEPEKFCSPAEVAEILRKETEEWKKDQERRARESPLAGLTPDQIAEKYKQTLSRMIENEPKLPEANEDEPVRSGE